MRLEVETGGVWSRSAISGKMCISPRCMIPYRTGFIEIIGN